jgi:hypothetical protein
MDSTIYVEYGSLIGGLVSEEISRHFILKTEWLNQSIEFPVSSGEVEIVNDSLHSLKFFLPFVDEYNAVLFCVPDGETDFEKRFEVNLSVADFGNSDDYGQMRCHNKESFPSRWCEFRNLAYFDHHFFFFTPAVFEFPVPFLVPGPRAPPFDKAPDRFVIEPIVLRARPFEIPRVLTVVKEFSYIYGVFHNYHMLWHTMFDFIIPLFYFIRVRNGTDTVHTRRVYVRSDGVWAFHAMVKTLTMHPVVVLDDENPSLLMRHGIVGIQKLERDMRENRTYDDSIGFNYDFNRTVGIGLRQAILRELSIPDNVVGENGKPLVLLIDRGSGTRNVENIQPLRTLLVEQCAHCEVRVVEFHSMEVEEQIRQTSRASVLVGFHGSGLAHTLWMAESRPNHTTHLIEIIPYKYLCRNWYQTAAAVAGVQYHRIMNRNRPDSSRDTRLDECWDRPEICATQQCHDLLRDQRTAVELDTFGEVWSEVAEQLKSTVAIEDR